MSDFQARLAAYEAQVRAKYTEAEIEALGKAGHAFKNPDGSFSYPIDDVEDLDHAIHAVGRGNADHDAIRKYIIGRAKDLGKSSMIPDDWNADGSLKEANSSEPQAAPRRSPIQIKRAFGSLTERPPALTTDLHIRMGDPGDNQIAQFHGYASTTAQRYGVQDWLGEYGETIQPGAFVKTLREATVPLLFNHDGMPLATYRAGDPNSTAALSEDSVGLLNTAALDRRSGNVNDLCIAMQRGDLNKMSFSFRAIGEDWNDTYDERSVTEAALYDTSIVTYPANPTTTAELRSAMRVLLGREGTSLMHSIREVLDLSDRAAAVDHATPLVENALRALASTDEIMCRRGGYQGRARMFAVARMLADVRQGKVLSAANEEMLKNALNALHEADDVNIPAIVKGLQVVDSALDAGQAGLAAVLDVANPDGDKDDQNPELTPAAKSNNSGMDGDQGGGSGGGGKNPLLPLDGAGPRAAKPSVTQTRRLLERLTQL